MIRVLLAAVLLCPGALADPVLVEQALQDPALTESERAALRRFHGRYTQDDLPDVAARAEVATWSWVVDDPSLDDPDTPPLARAKMLSRIGLRNEALDALGETASAQADHLRGMLLLDLGLADEARAALNRAAEAMDHTSDDPAERLAAIRSLRRLALLDERISQVDPHITRQLGRWRDLEDPTWWPARLLEVDILIERDSRSEVPAVLEEIRGLNPRSARGWHRLGLFAAGALSFEKVGAAVDELEDLAQGHVLAADIQAQASLLAGRPHEALAITDRVLERWPHQPEAVANRIAALALMGDDDAAEATWRDEVARARGWTVGAWRAGSMLSRHRRFDAADRWLGRVIQRTPGDTRAWTELGLMRWQGGDDDGARAALARAVELDPYNRRAANSDKLLAETAQYEELRSSHFIVRHPGGEHVVLARRMVPALDAIHEHVSARFGWTPPTPTVIEILPDHERFGVRTIGLPDIHTIAACTGPVIAMEPPRAGPAVLHQGPYAWAPVITHEYAHVLHLGQTSGRVPLWLTEGAAVSVEPEPLDFTARRMLAKRWRAGTLLAPDEHSWAFLRPRQPEDRALAYAQGYWMLEFLESRWDRDALPSLLSAIAAGASEDEAFARVTGMDLAAFHEVFLDEYAPSSIERWGLGHEPPLEELLDTATGETDPFDWLLDQYGDRPDAVLHVLEHRMTHDAWPTAEDIAVVEAYRAMQPLDAMPDMVLARWHERHGRLDAAEPHLARAAARSTAEPADLERLAMIRRGIGETPGAIEAMEAAVSMSPYDPTLRERAAALALESAHYDIAREHLESLILLEPDESVHRRRLEALQKKAGRNSPSAD